MIAELCRLQFMLSHGQCLQEGVVDESSQQS